MNQEIIATVADKEITQADFEAFTKALPAEQQAYLQNPAAVDYYKEKFVSLYLFAQMGEDEKLDETEEFKTIMKNTRRDVLGQMAIYKTLEGIEITEDEMMQYYEAHKDQFAKGPNVRAKHILADAEDKLKDILEEIKSGAKTFEEAAKEYSTCPSGQQGGDLGEFSKGQMVKEFEKAAFDAPIGEVVGPIQTQFGFHLIKVESRTEAKTSEFEEVSEQIKKALIQEKQQTLYDEKLVQLKEKYLK